MCLFCVAQVETIEGATAAAPALPQPSPTKAFSLLVESSNIWINVRATDLLSTSASHDIVFHSFPLEVSYSECAVQVTNVAHFFKDGKRMIWASERTGMRHLYLVNYENCTADSAQPTVTYAAVVDLLL